MYALLLYLLLLPFSEAAAFEVLALPRFVFLVVRDAPPLVALPPELALLYFSCSLRAYSSSAVSVAVAMLKGTLGDEAGKGEDATADEVTFFFCGDCLIC